MVWGVPEVNCQERSRGYRGITGVFQGVTKLSRDVSGISGLSSSIPGVFIKFRKDRERSKEMQAFSEEKYQGCFRRVPKML